MRKDELTTPQTPPSDSDPAPDLARPLRRAWEDDLDFGVALLLGMVAAFFFAVGLGAGVVLALAVVR